MDYAVDAVFDRRGENLTVGNVVRAGTRDGGQALDRKVQVGVAGALELHLVGGFHELLQRLHGVVHVGIVQIADVEVELLERFGRHIGELCHARIRPAQHDPACFVHARLDVHFAPNRRFVDLHAVAGNIRKLGHVVVAARPDVALHVLHLQVFNVGDELELLLYGVPAQHALDLVAFQQHQRHGPLLGSDAHTFGCKLMRYVDGFNQNLVAGLGRTRVVNQVLRQFGDTGVDHRLPLGISGEAGS